MLSFTSVAYVILTDNMPYYATALIINFQVS